MALDLTLCLVPPQFDGIIAKAHANAAYAEALAFLPTMLGQVRFDAQGDKLLMEMNRDVASLKMYYPPDASDAVLYDDARVSSTLDYLITEVGRQSSSLFSRPLWTGGDHLYSNSVSCQSLPLAIFDKQQVQHLASFLAGIDNDTLLTQYHYETMDVNGVYKLTRPEHTGLIVTYWQKVKKLFTFASHHSFYVIRMIS